MEAGPSADFNQADVSIADVRKACEALRVFEDPSAALVRGMASGPQGASVGGTLPPLVEKVTSFSRKAPVPGAC